jgi:hypothetical protein
MTNQIITDDPWDTSENPQMRQFEYWGEVHIDMYYAILQKGVGKVPYDPAQHSIDKRVTAIEIAIVPIAEQNITDSINRGMIAESHEWAGIVLPSIKALGISVRELAGRYVRVRQKPTGQTYVNAKGETKDRTTFEFIGLFKDRNACVADYLTRGAPSNTPTNTQYSGVNVSEEPTAANPGIKERDTALQFLKVVVENAVRGQTDLKVIRDTISLNVANMPLINKYFTVDSPETMQMIMEKMK